MVWGCISARFKQSFQTNFYTLALIFISSTSFAFADDLDPKLLSFLKAMDGNVNQLRLEDEFNVEEWKMSGTGNEKTVIDFDKAQKQVTIKTTLSPDNYTYAGQKKPLSKTNSMTFSTESPRKMLRFSEEIKFEERDLSSGEMIEKKETSRFNFKRHENNLDIYEIDDTIADKKVESPIEMPTLDEMTNGRLWVFEKPKIGDSTTNYTKKSDSLTKTTSKVVGIHDVDGKKIYTISQITAEYGITDKGEQTAESLNHYLLKIREDGLSLETRDVNGDLISKSVNNSTYTNVLDEEDISRSLGNYHFDEKLVHDQWNNPDGMDISVESKKAFESTSHQQRTSTSENSPFIFHIKKGGYTMDGPVSDSDINLNKAEALDPAIEKILLEKTKGKSDEEKLMIITQLTRESVAFCNNYPRTSTILSVKEISDFGIGVCVQRTEFFVSLCKAAGIPARGVIGYIINREANSDNTEGSGHKWAEVRLNNKWIAVEPSAITDTSKIPSPLENSLYIRFMTVPKEENLKSSERYTYEQFGKVVVTGIEKTDQKTSKEKPLKKDHKSSATSENQ